MSEARVFTIIDDVERDHPENIEGFGLTVFVPDAFAEELIGTPRAHSSARFYERFVAGDNILLTREALDAAHLKTGINALGLHFGMHNHDLSNPRSGQVLNVGSAACHFFHAGWHFRTMMYEVYGEQTARYMKSGGFRLVHDFRKMSPATFADVPDDEIPYFFAVRREWVEPGAISGLSQLFAVPPPRIHFSAAERRLLERALLNESDATIAKSIGISLNTVMKTWRGIYERVNRRLPQLIPEGSAADGSRGHEKRRHLLFYLRTHLEELRPIADALDRPT